MARSLLSTPDLPNLDGVAVLGGKTVCSTATDMARYLGQEVVAAGHILLTGGRHGAGEAAAAGAAAWCKDHGLDPCRRVFSLVPNGTKPDFAIGQTVPAGCDKTDRSVLLVQCTTGAVVIGGDTGTANEVFISVLQAIMNGYAIIPACGTGGVADRMCRKIAFEDALLNDPTPSAAKGQALVRRLLCRPCWYCDIDPVAAHDKWFFVDRKDDVARRMYHLRHTYF